MAASRSRAASAKSAGAARAERSGKPKSLTFRRQKLEIPAELPPAFAYDFGQAQMYADKGDEERVLSILHRLLSDVFGEQMDGVIRGLIRGIDDPWETELIRAVLSAYGMESGKS